MKQYHARPEDDLRRFLAEFPAGTYVAVHYRPTRHLVTYVGVVVGSENGRVRIRHTGSGEEQLLRLDAIVDVRAASDPGS